jgi:hypothetical protein
MGKSVQLLAVMTVLSLVSATEAMAQASRTWVSGVGDDANPCSRTAPCKTFGGTISKTAAAGEINVLDPGGFGAVTITKSITIRSDSFLAGIVVSSGSGIIINAGAADKIVLDGLDIDGFPNGTSVSANGISVISARDVIVRNSSIRGFIQPASAGILVNAPINNASVTVENCTIFNNTVGVKVSSALGNGTARIYNSQITVSPTAGVSVTGAGNRIELSGNVIVRTPLSLQILSGGAISSYSDNVLSAGDAPSIVPKG